MLANTGSILIELALGAALYTTFAALWDILQAAPRRARRARNGTRAATALLALALLALLLAFLGDEFQIRYVAQHSRRELPLYLKIAALWAGQEGSLLLWAFLQALFAALVVNYPSHRTRPLTPWATVFLSLITAFFTAVTLFLSNPFVQSETAPLDGQGLNPLLRHPGMIFHPLALYLGYVGLTVPFAFALAALVTRQVKSWPSAARRWTLAAWLFLGLGLLLGARWAYDVLGWGGYWGWDAVENAGLLPWLTATALLHSMAIQEQRGGFRWWTISLAILSFTLVLFGAFTTRSGLIQSVHAFALSNLGPHFLAAIGLTLAASLTLMISRRSLLTDPRPAKGLLSRDGMFFLTLTVLLTITASVFIGAMLPTITQALTGQRLEAGPAWFDQVTGPQFAALVLLMGLCPLLGRAAGALQRWQGQAWPVILGGIAVPAAAALAGFTQPLSLIGFAVIGLAGAATLAEYARDALSRSRRFEENLLRALWTLFRTNSRKYGGYAVHTGVVLMALGVVGTRMYPIEAEKTLRPGDLASVEEYTFLFERLEQEPAGDHLSTQAALSVYRNEKPLTRLRPALARYPDFDMMAATPALRMGLREELYVTLAGWEGKTATFKILVNSLASFLWLGGLILLGGGAAALWPSAPAKHRPIPEARRRMIGSAVGLTVGLLVLGAAVVTMWGTGLGMGEAFVGRPLPGQPAPDFTLDLLNGPTLTLSQLRGQIVVVNFWAAGSPSCAEVVQNLQTMWQEYQSQEVTFIGLAYQEQETDVSEFAARLGLTYPIGLDRGGRIQTAYGATDVPETFVIDAQGRVAHLHIGPVTEEQLRAEMDGLLGR